jgi:hypothetical protein
MRRRALSGALIALGLLSTVTAAAGVAGSSALAVAPAAARGLTVGFAADNSLLDGTAATRSVWLDRAVAEGARIVRVPVVWSEVAPLRRPAGFRPQDPGSPGYNWSSTDETVRELSQHGLTPLLMILSAPTWAEGAHRPKFAQPGTWEPDPGQFASFARAAAQRYSGAYPDPLYRGESLPRVRYWQAWNEPNLAYYFGPQWTRVGNRYAPASPNLYRRMLNGFYAAVKGVARSNYVLMGGTAPYGDPPGGARMQPLAFYRSLFCLTRTLAPLRCPAPVHLDGVDHHPYGVSPEQSAFLSDDVAVPNVWKIGRVLNAAVRDGHVLPRVHKDMWVTELGWNSRPPVIGPRAVSVATQARYVELAEYLLWKQGVSTVMSASIRDAPSSPRSPQVFDWSGMYFYSGTPKPAATAFLFPFVAQRRAAGSVELWGRAPDAGVLQISRQLPTGNWILVAQFPVQARQVFVTNLPLKGPAVLRATVGSSTSLPWREGG